MSSVKIVAANYAAMRHKGYTGAGLTSVREALTGLVEADRDRGVDTTVVDLGSPDDMARYGAPEVTDPADARQNKDAVDAVFHGVGPDYLMLLGSHDVIPHQQLKNPVPHDDDPVVPSDLPYACETTYGAGRQEPGRYTAPSRVVGRLPDVTGEHDPAYLTGLLGRAAAVAPADRGKYEGYFGLSAAVWEKSTRENLATLFGDASALHLVPPGGSPWQPGPLAARSHFVNCHGAAKDSHWYGQGSSGYPVALKAGDIDGHLADGTVLAAECCYGAELYRPPAAPHLPLCNTYLGSGALVFFGSTTIAYGPADSCDQADLITQYLVRELLQGQSGGYAALKARLDYVKLKGRLDPVDLKTLAQFVLLGDPSAKPVKARAKAVGGTDPGAARTHRRREARLVAHMLEQSVSVPEPLPGTERDAGLTSRLRDIAERHDLPPSYAVSSFAAVWKHEGEAQKSFGQPPRQHLLHAQRDPDAPVRTDVVVVIREQDGDIVSVDEYEAR
ncbi:hypothetical protein B7P34_02185 [Streptosporangium nondiastaticum]|uniref:Gingipain domain-containing protein n=1 Tax=Streptosporangium nondiastaticum TaxID=35764 RepID=A0A9X7JVG6_9ACTN|nr:hypothetical protein [Streptosporangium nondiastaticum]PSJ30389.1 hypothetical protein B7P34_02185 [Streptosporangium nondiastaticum]